MNDIDWTYAGFSVLTALTLGLAVGLAIHWILGLVVGIAWVAIHVMPEGFGVVQDAVEEVAGEARRSR